MSSSHSFAPRTRWRSGIRCTRCGVEISHDVSSDRDLEQSLRAEEDHAGSTHFKKCRAKIERFERLMGRMGA
jgi:hypothetical protein